MTRSHRVLVVEDDAWVAEQHVRTLEAADFNVAHAPDVLAAIEAVDVYAPDVLILDIFLIGPNAFTLLHELKSHVDLAKLPVILCTNSADMIILGDVSAYGVLEVLDKATMLPNDLVSAVKRVLL